MKRPHLASLAALSFAVLTSACTTDDGSPTNLARLWEKTPSDAQLEAAAVARETNPNRPTRWWNEISKKPDSFYRSAEGKTMAENILSWQNAETGGWPLMNTTGEAFTGDKSRAGPWGLNAALIKATVNEVRFLARGYRATKDERYKDAAMRGLEFIYKAQHPSGGWPHSYPLRMNDYSHFATFNDDEMPDLMALLSTVATAPEFAFVQKEGRERARAAFARGVDFVLKSQIVVNGNRTAWAQQYDEVTYEPKPARAFEPVAISGGESASVLHMLMDIPKPSPEVQQAIEAGVQWYREAQIDGLKLIREDGDRVVTPDPNAPPIWARFYEIETGRPIFAGRDGVIKYAMAEIEKERRGGYAWYNYSGTTVFERYAEWKNERRWDAQPQTNTDEAKVQSYTLPDLLTTQTGTPVKTIADWETKRRPEIMDLLANYQEGVTPTKSIATRIEMFEMDGTGLDGKAHRRQARIHYVGYDDVNPIRVLLYTPKDAKGPVPTLLHLSFTPNVQVFKTDEGLDEGMAWSASLKAPVPDREATFVGGFDAASFINNGYGVAIIYYGDIYPDFAHDNTLGIMRMFPRAKDQPTPDNEWGAIGAWSWGLSRVMDFLQTDDRVDATKVALSGVSRLGKTALWAGAQDKRFAVIMPLLSGEGGAAISRRNYGETIADLTNPSRYHYWYAPKYQDYAFKAEELPVDGHMLLAMIAPRPVLQIVGTEDAWSDPKGEYEGTIAAQNVWQLYNKNANLTHYPKPNQPVLADMGFLLHEGGHTTLPIDIKTMVDFLDLHFK